MTAETTRELISFYEQQAKSEGRSVTYDLSAAPKTVADALAANPESAEQLADRIKIAGAEGYAPDRLSILGETTVEKLREDVYQTTIKLYRGANPLTVVEETVEGKTREALDSGRISMDWLRSEVQAYERHSGEELLTGTDQSVIEAVSSLGRAYFAGKVQERALPNSLAKFFHQLAVFFNHVVSRAIGLKKAIAEGAVSHEFESFLADSVGIPIDQQLETVGRGLKRNWFPLSRLRNQTRLPRPGFAR